MVTLRYVKCKKFWYGYISIMRHIWLYFCIFRGLLYYRVHNPWTQHDSPLKITPSRTRHTVRESRLWDFCEKYFYSQLKLLFPLYHWCSDYLPLFPPSVLTFRKFYPLSVNILIYTIGWYLTHQSLSNLRTRKNKE